MKISLVNKPVLHNENESPVNLGVHVISASILLSCVTWFLMVASRRRSEGRSSQNRFRSNNASDKVSILFKVLIGVSASLFMIFMVWSFVVACAFNRHLLKSYIIMLAPAALVFVILSVVIVIHLTKEFRKRYRYSEQNPAIADHGRLRMNGALPQTACVVREMVPCERNNLQCLPNSRFRIPKMNLSQNTILLSSVALGLLILAWIIYYILFVVATIYWRQLLNNSTQF
ncbi:hypothetical protein D915_000819 [Fasciola hepatica]|uniref:Uncharacterized protein n=1 Tax=Fasciola hepatica TaxID=6192 RepID=A0A4E0RJK2_FASHE|nr:hypothetical protein D915_000819 [Fasciola hepatica]